jgi:hypothetical protein
MLWHLEAPLLERKNRSHDDRAPRVNGYFQAAARLRALLIPCHRLSQHNTFVSQAYPTLKPEGRVPTPMLPLQLKILPTVS